MSRKLLKLFAAVALIGGTLVVTFDAAGAGHRRHSHYGYGPWGPPGFGFGIGVRYGYPGPHYPHYPYPAYRYYTPYYAPYHYGPPRCERIVVRTWRHGRLVWRRAVRCW